MIRESENKKQQTPPAHFSYLCQATKTGVLRFLSHREWITATERTMRRAVFPLWFTQGFHPKPKLTFSRALPTGLISEAIYFIVRLTEDSLSTSELMRSFNEQSPDGLKMKGLWQLKAGERLNAFLDLWSFRVIVKDGLSSEKRKAITEYVEGRATETKFVILDKSFFMIEYKTVEQNWLDYRDIMQTLYGERFPRLFYLPVLREVHCNCESCIPVSDLFDLHGRQ